jgi:hypothetical protein
MVQRLLCVYSRNGPSLVAHHKCGDELRTEGCFMHWSYLKQRSVIAFMILATLLLGTETTWAQATNPELEALKQEIEELRRRDAEKEKKLEELQRQIEVMRSQMPTAEKSATPHVAREEALKEIDQPAPAPVATDLLSRRVGGSTFRSGIHYYS